MKREQLYKKIEELRISDDLKSFFYHLISFIDEEDENTLKECLKQIKERKND